MPNREASDRVIGALLGFCVGEHLSDASASAGHAPSAPSSRHGAGHLPVGTLGRELLRSAVAVANALVTHDGYAPDVVARAVGPLDDGDAGIFIARSLPFAQCITTRAELRPVDLVNGAWLSGSVQPGFSPRRGASERAVVRAAVRAVAYRINGDDMPDCEQGTPYVGGLEHPGYSEALWNAANDTEHADTDTALRLLASPGDNDLDLARPEYALLGLIAEAARLARSLEVSEHSWRDRLDRADPAAAALAAALVGAQVGVRRLPDLARSMDLAPAAWVCAQLLTGASHDPVLLHAWGAR